MRPVAPRALLIVRLVLPSRFPLLLRVCTPKLERLEAPVEDIGGQSIVVVEPALDVLHGFVVLVVVGVEAVIARVAGWLEVDENIGIKTSLQRKRPSMQHGSTLVQNHITRLHRHIVSPPIVPIHLQRPRLVDVLGDIDDRAGDQGQTIDVRVQDGSLRVLPDAVEGGGRELLAGPFLKGVTGDFPYHVFEFFACPLELVVVHIQHPCGAFPVVGVSIPSIPLLHLLPPLIIFPKSLNGLEHPRRSLDLGEPHFGIIHHALGLSQIHRDPIRLVAIAQLVIRTLVMPAFLHEMIV
mmetsp:Transcript_2670/g.6667  ORF Transcript_2670/g.6667 Transcript_2670/m.6667 type:complete len:295 (+) Transcript_2670:547-1431(+)